MNEHPVRLNDFPLAASIIIAIYASCSYEGACDTVYSSVNIDLVLIISSKIVHCWPQLY